MLLPGIILQSVLIGGGFATGREIVEYGAKFGANGWISGLVITLGFMLISVLCFEACRVWNAYDYRLLMKKMIGKVWFLYEWIYLPLAILTVAVMASAAGEILFETLKLQQWVGITAVVLVVSILLQLGDRVISMMKTVGTVALLSSYTVFGIIVFARHNEAVMEVMKTQDSTGTLPGIIWTGILYVGYNLGVYPASFYTVQGLQTRKESIYAGVASGVIMAIPWFLTYVALMGFYPDPTIMHAPVPWLRMLATQSPILIGVFGAVIGWTLIETATGVIHAFIHRIANYKKESGNVLLTWHRSVIALCMLVGAILLSQVGIIDLVAKGYSTMAYGMIAVFAVPLLVRGVKLFLN